MAFNGWKSLKNWVFLGSILVGFSCMLLAAYFGGSPRSQAVLSGAGKESNRIIWDLTFDPEIPIDKKNRTQIGIENATLLMLVRNFELHEALEAMREIEDRFNKHYRYPWTFLNDHLFTDEFKELTKGMASGKVEYGHIDWTRWSVPDHVDFARVQRNMKQMEKDDVLYGSSLSYRHMCRFNSGYFFREPLVEKYDYYWRVEPSTHFFCDQEYDPFTFMRLNNKVYGFVISIYEYENTIPTLWNTSKAFFDAHPEYVASDNAMDFITDKTVLRPDDMGAPASGEFNMCHFWSNFEIGDLNFFRSKAYVDYFNHLDEAGGFFYERWGDAPVHTIAVATMLNKSQIHHFSDIGYSHTPYYRCPHDDASFLSGRCLCPHDADRNIDFASISCLPRWWHHAGKHFMFHKPLLKDQVTN